MKTSEITEKFLAKANLTDQEKKVARVEFKLETAGKRTKYWVEHLSERKHSKILANAQSKIYKALKAERAKGAGN